MQQGKAIHNLQLHNTNVFMCFKYMSEQLVAQRDLLYVSLLVAATVFHGLSLPARILNRRRAADVPHEPLQEGSALANSTYWSGP